MCFFFKWCELVACQRFRSPRSLAHDYINVCQVSWLILVCRRERCVCIYINNIYKYSNSSTLEVCALQCMLEIYFVRAIKARELTEHCWVTDVIVSLFEVGFISLRWILLSSFVKNYFICRSVKEYKLGCSWNIPLFLNFKSWPQICSTLYIQS